MHQIRLFVLGALSAAVIGGCTSNASVDRAPVARPAYDGLSGTPAQFNRMSNRCIAQAARRTGMSPDSITVIDRIRTGGGPLITLNAGGTKYSCRLEGDGRVTVFSEFAN